MATETNPKITHQTVHFFTPTKPSSSRIHEPSSVSMVRVIVRVRPFLPHEISSSKDGMPTACVASVLDDSAGEVTVHLKDQETSRSECYKLDSFFGQEDNHVSQIFQREVRPLIPGIFCGRNATVFAYGATGSGKTFTMQGSDESPGVMPLAMSTILSMCQIRGYYVEISYYEVYMDRCYDLLEVKAKEIAVLDDKDGQVHLKGLAKVPVNSMSEFDEVFACGVQRRKVAHTGLNDVSSRSHGVLVITISRPCEDDSVKFIGKLNLIDLAGNEDNRRTGNEGLRLHESAKINQSLFALSNVIYALNNNKARVPYRESKLTRILQDSLGGRNHALMVACLNPGEYQECVHTVSLAARSRRISNYIHSGQKQQTPKVKIDMEAKLLAWLESKGKTKSAQRHEALRSPFSNKTPSSIRAVRKLQSCQTLPKPSAANNEGVVTNIKESPLRVPCGNLFSDEDPKNPILEYPAITKDDASKKLASYGDEVVMESALESPGKLVDDKKGNVTPTKAVDPLGSAAMSERNKDLARNSREALSPLNSNILVQNMSFREQICQALYDPMTPKGPFLLNREVDKLKNSGNKFNALSSVLKKSLAQEYIDFLNAANKDELLEVKGIGEKMAEYIIELRETSPLKALNDLEKIGLSSKQVYKMFGRAAKGLFD